jgi:hypothetical protein
MIFFKGNFEFREQKKVGEERSGELGGCGRLGMEYFTEKCLTTPCEWAHYHDGGASFPQSTFQVVCFVLHLADVSEPPEKSLDLQE